ncbi:MAG TPA: hypothetical protein VJ949_07715 [Cryomorphaceae bacterium]|nr:hypothetical protein [Cryomorphaceae bacterium]
MRNVLKIALIGFAFFSTGTCLSQVKYEREYRIKKDTIAENACVFIHQSEFLEEKTRVKWYREESEDGTSTEAKFKQNVKRYSIEFDETGKLQDVELEIDESEIPVETMKKISVILERNFDRWKIKKVQRQWIGSEIEVIESINKEYAADGVEENFEIVIKGKVGNEKNYYELLFDQTGELMRQQRIVEQSSDILIF